MTDLEALQAEIGQQVTGTITINGEILAVTGRLDGIGFITDDKIMVAIGDNEGDGIVYMVPNDPASDVTLEVLS